MARRLEKAKKAAPKATATEAPTAAGVRAIFSPTLDFLCVGGIGICALAAIALSPDALPGETLPFGAMILLALINIHHFFIDGCVWKISTPEVKKDLFRHLVK